MLNKGLSSRIMDIKHPISEPDIHAKMLLVMSFRPFFVRLTRFEREQI